MPRRSPSAVRAVAITTPVGNWPRTSRNRLGSMANAASSFSPRYTREHSYVTKSFDPAGDTFVMLEFDRHSARGRDRISLAPEALVVAGWTGRDEAALRHHIEELAAIGVPRPSSVPVFYRNSATNVTQAARIQALGPDTSGEAEPVVVTHGGKLWLTVGSDHTDRKAETMGIALSKQLCAKPVGRELWLLDDVVAHWDQLKLRAYATIDGRRVTYQEGTLA